MKYRKYRKSFTKRALLSNELKKALFTAFLEAKKHKTYVTTELLLYGLLAQHKSLGARLVSTTISEFRNDKSLTSKVISNKVYRINETYFNSEDRANLIKSNEFSSELWSENSITPWLSIEVKELLKKCLAMSLKGQKKVVIVTTKDIIFELLNKEYIYDLLTEWVYYS